MKVAPVAAVQVVWIGIIAVQFFKGSIKVLLVVDVERRNRNIACETVYAAAADSF